MKAIWKDSTTPQPTTYTVTVNNDGNGTASPDKTSATKGETITLTATPVTGYHFKEWQSSDVTVTGNTFTMPEKNVTVKAIFEADAPSTYAVTVNTDGNGTASPDKTSAAKGETITLTATPAPGYHFKEWQTSDVTISGNSFTMPEKNVTVKAIFEADASTNYIITFDANGGSVTPASDTTGTDGKLATLPTPTRSGSYRFDGWYTAANGGTKVTVDNVYTTKTTIYAHWTYTGGSGGSSSGGSSSGSSASATYAITVADSTHGSVTVSPKSASTGDTVKITVSPDKGYTLETITVTDKNGKEVALTATKIGETYTFKMPAGAVEIEATFMDDNTMLNYFIDVPADAYYYDAVLWAAEQGITGGVDAVHFDPNAGCTRAQVVTFLWRAAGCPEPESPSSFADVNSAAYYTKAIAWAAEQGITGGTSATTFSPDATCTRAQIMTFLYRFNGVDTMEIKDNPFTDVAEGQYYSDAVLWGAKSGITGGTTATTFSPDATCTRAQIVTFLYRYMA